MTTTTTMKENPSKNEMENSNFLVFLDDGRTYSSVGDEAAVIAGHWDDTTRGYAPLV